MGIKRMEVELYYHILNLFSYYVFDHYVRSYDDGVFSVMNVDDILFLFVILSLFW